MRATGEPMRATELDDVRVPLPAPDDGRLTPVEEYRHAAYSIALRGGQGSVDVSNACAALVERDRARFGRLVRDYGRALLARPKDSAGIADPTCACGAQPCAGHALPLISPPPQPPAIRRPPYQAPPSSVPCLVVLALGFLLTGCGFKDAPPMVPESTCALADLTVEIEAGADTASCDYVARVLTGYRELYERRFGHVDMSDRPVRMRATNDLRTVGVSADFKVGGETYTDAIDLVAYGYIALPHEMHHVQNGPGHGGWCDDFAPWSKVVLGWNQDAYLGCD